MLVARNKEYLESNKDCKTLKVKICDSLYLHCVEDIVILGKFHHDAKIALSYKLKK